MKKTTDKPFTLQVGDFRKELIDLINSFKLPAYVIKNELKDIYDEINQIDLEEINKYNEKESEDKCQK